MEVTLLIIGLTVLHIGMLVLSRHIDVLIRIAKNLPKGGKADALKVQQKSDISCTYAEVLHYLASRYFAYNPDSSYTIAYNLVYQNAIEILREEGWKITLETDPSGNLFYVFHNNRVTA